MGGVEGTSTGERSGSPHGCVIMHEEGRAYLLSPDQTGQRLWRVRNSVGVKGVRGIVEDPRGSVKSRLINQNPGLSL